MNEPRCRDESERLNTLESYGIVDTPREVEFDQLTRLASHICQTPVALVSLVTADRQWFKSRVGLEADETPLDISFCTQALLEPDLLVVPDTTKDPRFAHNPLVRNEPHLRFYAGAQLRSPDGYGLGTLCVLDYRPRQLSNDQLTSLRMLADHVMHLLERRRTLKRQTEITARLQRRIEAYRTNRRMVSHDLRSPLTTAHLAAQQLTIDPDDETTSQLAEHVLRATKKMTLLIDDLLGDAPESVVRPVACSPTDLVEETIGFFEVPADNAGIELRSDFVEPVADVECDPRRTIQILHNLVSNALKFTPAGNTVTVRTRSFGRDVLLEIEDTGPGIPDEELDYIFEAHYRSRSASEDGSGLGLAIARHLVEMQGGRIGVESTEGEGTVFWFTLPQARHSRSTPPRSSV